jgi:hypothetical protein
MSHISKSGNTNYFIHRPERRDIKYFPSPGSDDDRAWFLKHPERSYRVRPAMGDEAPDTLTGMWTLVHQVAPGQRLRIVVGLNTATPRDDEEGAASLFARASQNCPIIGEIAHQISQWPS